MDSPIFQLKRNTTNVETHKEIAITNGENIFRFVCSTIANDIAQYTT